LKKVRKRVVSSEESKSLVIKTFCDYKYRGEIYQDEKEVDRQTFEDETR
jgi:hypothetical protein